jgi:hypothetical protein
MWVSSWVRARLCKLQKWCTRLAAENDKVYQLLAHGRWFSPGIPASSATKTGCHDIAEILLKVALDQYKHVVIISIYYYTYRSTPQRGGVEHGVLFRCKECGLVLYILYFILEFTYYRLSLENKWLLLLYM